MKVLGSKNIHTEMKSLAKNSPLLLLLNSHYPKMNLGSKFSRILQSKSLDDC